MKTRSKEEFIQLAKTLYCSKFTYDKVIYKNNYTKVVITCPIHGDFEQTPLQHLRGNGCIQCTSDKNLEQRKQTFLQEANSTHNSKYMYDMSTYLTNRSNIRINCPEHGDFYQTPSNHLKGHGCRKCQYIAVAEKNSKSQETFIVEATHKHNSFYDYTKVNYKNSKTEVTIICPIHGAFNQLPNHHLKGSGCPKCAETGFNQSKIGYLYYLSINNGQAYKIGITNRSVQERFTVTDLQSIQVLNLWKFPDGAKCYAAEQAILKQFKKFQYKDQKLLSSGNTELFNIDIYQTYKEQINEITTMGKLQTP